MKIHKKISKYNNSERGITVTIGTNGAVAVSGTVDANTVIFASYKGE